MGKVLKDDAISRFILAPAELIKYEILARLDRGDKIKISLSEVKGECPSGYCAATWGCIKIEYCDRMPFAYYPKTDIEVPDLDPRWIGKTTGIPDIENIYFSYSEDEGDSYYPSGHIRVNEDLFVASDRVMKKRPVYIFTGPSAIGKSTMASMLDRTVYETDRALCLPEVIAADIVVCGNKYPHTIEDIELRLFGSPDVIVVRFDRAD